MNCPLCNNDRYIISKRFKIEELIKKWNEIFHYNPYKETFNEELLKLKCIECGLEYYYPNIVGENELYERLGQYEWYYEDNKWEFDEAINLILEYKPDNLLEIGCGNGNFLRKVVNAVPEIYGIDINQNAIESCKKFGLNVIKRGINDVTGKYDFILLFEVIEHLNDFKTIFDKLYNILNDGGFLIIATPNPESYLMKINCEILDLPPHHSSSWSYQTYNYLAQKYKYKIVKYEKEPLRYNHYKHYLSNELPMQIQSIYRTNNIFNRLIHRYRLFLKDILNPIEVKLDRLDHLLYVLEEKNIKGQTHMVAFKKNSSKYI